MQESRAIDSLQGKFDLRKIDSCAKPAARSFGRLDEDPQTMLRQAAVNERLCCRGIPDAGFHGDTSIEKAPHDSWCARFVEIDGGEIWQYFPRADRREAAVEIRNDPGTSADADRYSRAGCTNGFNRVGDVLRSKAFVSAGVAHVNVNSARAFRYSCPRLNCVLLGQDRNAGMIRAGSCSIECDLEKQLPVWLFNPRGGHWTRSTPAATTAFAMKDHGAIRQRPTLSNTAPYTRWPYRRSVPKNAEVSSFDGTAMKR
jgi:hypothetical protein